MIITKKIQVRDEVLASGGFSDVRSGTLAGCRVAVRTLRVATQDDVQKIRNVSIDDIFSAARDVVMTVLS